MKTEGGRTIYISPFVLKWKALSHLKSSVFLHYKGIRKYNGNSML